MAVDLSSLWLIISPVAINFLILKVSGVPMLEELMEGRPGFQDYKKRTPIFFPWFPKK
jgi:steroid 5-alpha reductase family enzyme